MIDVGNIGNANSWWESNAGASSEYWDSALSDFPEWSNPSQWSEQDVLPPNTWTPEQAEYYYPIVSGGEPWPGSQDMDYTMDAVDDTSDTTGDSTDSTTMALNEFQFPSQWGLANDFWTNLLSGEYNISTPSQWTTSTDYYNQLLSSGGSPVDLTAYQEAMQPVLQQQIKDQINASLEAKNLTGTRYGSGAQWAVSDAVRRFTEDYAFDLASKNLEAQEAAKSRMMTGAEQLGTLGQMETGLGLSNLANQQTAASALTGLGENYLYAPLNVSQGMMSLANMLYGMQSGQASQISDSSYLAALSGLAGGNYYYPQSYTAGTGTQMSNIFAMLPFYMSMLNNTGGE